MTPMHPTNAKARLPNGFLTARNIISAMNLSLLNRNQRRKPAKKTLKQKLTIYLKNNLTTEATEAPRCEGVLLPNRPQLFLGYNIVQ